MDSHDYVPDCECHDCLRVTVRQLRQAAERLAEERKASQAEAMRNAMAVGQACIELSEAKATHAAVPGEVMRALDRMCTPLDDSWLGSKTETAQADARCMKVIRDHIMRPAVKDSLTTAATTAVVSVGDSFFEPWYSLYNPEGKSTKQTMREAYEAGMLDHDGRAPVAQKVPDDVARGAERYRLLRQLHWNDGPICCVTAPSESVRLGAYCPSGELLDEFLDSLLAAAQKKEGS